MKIGGLQKQSLIDYPGKICCVLFLAGCNFNCPYCHNPQLVGDSDCRPETIADDAGYEAVNSFSRAFKRAFGKPPSVWRRRSRKRR